MPKNTIDYSNTIIYKIFCKDNNINDIYVGHTTNFPNRKCQHKTSINNSNNKNKIYETIRKNGGWDNWDMVEIAQYNCKDHTEARIKEQEHYEILKANLNSFPPFITKSDNKYCCDNCKYICNKKSSWNQHLQTTKHNKALNQEKIENKKYICEKCNIKLTHQSSWSRHKKICLQKTKLNETIDKEKLLVSLIEQNTTLLKQNNELLEVIKNEKLLQSQITGINP